MSAVKVDNAWLKILSIKIKDNGVWIDHQAIYAKHSGDWYLIDLGAEASGPLIYTWKAYADDDQGNGISLSPENKSFIGFSTGQESPTVDLSDPSIFDWSQLKFYTWRAYADDNQGNGISLSPTGKDFIGVAYNMNGPIVDISDPSIFTWTSASGGLTQGDVDSLIDSAFSDFVASDHNQQAIATINGIINQFNDDLAAETADLVRQIEFSSLSSSLDGTNADLASYKLTVASKFEAQTTEISTLSSNLANNYSTTSTLNQAIADEVTARNLAITAAEARVDDNYSTKTETSTLIATEAQARSDAISTLTANVGSTYATQSALDAVIADADGNAESISILTGTVNNETTGLSATRSLAQSAKTTADGAASSISTINGRLDNETNGLSATYSFVSGVSTDLTTLEGVINHASTGLSATRTTANNANSTANSAYSDAQSALSSISVLSNTVGNNSSGLVQEVNALSAKNFLGVNASGRITGIYIEGSATESNIALQADKVSFVTPGGVSKLYWSGSDLVFDGTLRIGGTSLTASNTLNINTTKSDVGLGNVDNTSDAYVLGLSQAQADDAKEAAELNASLSIGGSLGVVPAFSNNDPNTITYDVNEQALKLHSSTDVEIGMSFAPFRVNVQAGEVYKLALSLKSNVSTSSGVYIRIYEYNQNLPAGKTHIANENVGVVQMGTSSHFGWHNNSSVSTSWETRVYNYTPTAGAAWASVVVLNWTNLGYNSLYVKNFVRELDVNAATKTAGTIAGWNINSDYIYSGGTSVSGNYSASGHFFLRSNGEIRSPKFAIHSNGNAFFKGDITGANGTFSGTVSVGGTALTTSNTLNSNTQWNEINSRPTNLAGLDSSANSKLAGISANADVTNYNDTRVSNTTAAANANTAAKNAGTVGGWNINSTAMWSGTYQASNAYTTSGMTLHKDGAIRAKEFRIDTNGNAYFKGDITGAKGTFSGTISGGTISIGSDFTVNSSGRLTADNAILNRVVVFGEGIDAVNASSNTSGPANTFINFGSGEGALMGSSSGEAANFNTQPGFAPFRVNSNVRVSNLNAHYLDGVPLSGIARKPTYTLLYANASGNDSSNITLSQSFKTFDFMVVTGARDNDNELQTKIIPVYALLQDIYEADEAEFMLWGGHGADYWIVDYNTNGTSLVRAADSGRIHSIWGLSF